MTTQTVPNVDKITDQVDRIAEARKMGFGIGVDCAVHGGVRTMQSDRMLQQGDNVLAMGSHPFFLRYKGEWVAEVKKRKVLKYID